ncbi:MAG: DUF3618 domain-containing protein [Microbacteriaceae bacterium]
MSMRDIEADIAATRAELEQTLQAIEDKFNIPKQAAKAKERVTSSYERNPRPWLIGAAVAVVAIGGLITMSVLKRR